MAVFAVVIPFTNPIKFTQYVVTLAFHVLAMWFIKCPVNSRNNFVNFITKTLRNVIGPGDLIERRRSTGDNRGTTSSIDHLTQDLINKYATNHRNMTTILLDLMSRYAYASASPIPRRSEWAEAMVGTGYQRTWIMGLKVVTITTSGCAIRPISGSEGFCENCISICRKVKAEINERKSLINEPKTCEEAEEHKLASLSSSNSSLGQDDRSKDVKNEAHRCTCWCAGYAEIFIRQPTGSQAWMTRVGNTQHILVEGNRMSLDDLATLYGPSITSSLQDVKFRHEVFQKQSDQQIEEFVACQPTFQRSVSIHSDEELKNYQPPPRLFDPNEPKWKPRLSTPTLPTLGDLDDSLSNLHQTPQSGRAMDFSYFIM